MHSELKIEAGGSIECKNCGRRTTVPALKIEPGVKCAYCGAVLKLGMGEAVEKAVLLHSAAGHNDIKVD